MVARREKAIADHMDVGLMPLQDNPYQRAKCGAKLLQYMAAGLPVIAAPVGVNREIVADSVNGLSAAGPDDWWQAIQRLTEQEKLRTAFRPRRTGIGCAKLFHRALADQWVGHASMK